MHQILALTMTVFLETLFSIKHTPGIISDTQSTLPKEPNGACTKQKQEKYVFVNSYLLTNKRN